MLLMLGACELYAVKNFFKSPILATVHIIAFCVISLPTSKLLFLLFVIHEELVIKEQCTFSILLAS